MHELSIASAIVDQVMEFAQTRAVERVVRVRLAIGELAGLERDQLAFCYRAITEESPLQGSTLEFESVEPIVACPSCDYRGAPKYWQEAQHFAAVPTLACPRCGAAVRAVQGHECAIRTISYAT